MAFDAKKHLIKLKDKWYLEAKWRIMWMRDEHPDWRISTEVISLDPPIVKAVVMDAEGAVIATAHGGAVDKGNAVWSGRSIEKAETAALGRALAHAGYGTQFLESDADHLADSPIGEQRRPSNGRATAPRPAPAKKPVAADPLLNGAREMGATVTEKPWTEKEANEFTAHWHGQGVSGADLLKALKIKRWGEWKQSRQAADKAVNAYIESEGFQESA